MILRFAIFLLGLLAATSLWSANLSWSEQIPVSSYEKMREVERYQMQIAEKHYLKGEYKIALAEYEKFLGLYERSSGAPYAQLMWSHCQVRLRKVNTGIREGFQSVVDYWPESPEAVLASYLIARSYQDIGEVGKAKAAYKVLLEEHQDGTIPVSAKRNLLEMARTEKNEQEILVLLEDLTYSTKRTKETTRTCTTAASELASWHMYKGNWDESKRALATTYKDGALDEQVFHKGNQALGHLLRNEDTKKMGQDVAGRLFELAESQIPDDLTKDGAKGRARTALDRIAGLHAVLGDKEKILKTYERAAKLTGTDDAIRGKYASYWKTHGENRDKAKGYYRQYENQVAGLGAIAGMLKEEGKYDEAIEQYRELIKIHADGINGYLKQIADLYEHKKDWKTAIQTWRQVDEFPSTYFRMASCHRRLKQYKEALSLYGQAKSSEPHAASAMIHIGHTYEEAGQRENAIKTFQQTCRIYPKSGEASKAHAHLQTKYNINVTLGGAKDE